MLKNRVIKIIGFGFGAFMIFNSACVFYRMVRGVEWVITPFEKMLSFGVTFSIGVVLIIWTYLLTKRR